MFLRILILFLLIISISVFSKGQDTARKVKLLPVPTLGYSPETRTYLGAVTLFTLDFYRDSVTRRSNAKIELTYTWNKQLIFETAWSYFFKEEKWFTKGKLYYSDYPDSYYGIGSGTGEKNKVTFNSMRVQLEANLLKGVGDSYFFGPEIRFLNYLNVRQNGSIWYPELVQQSVIGIGFSLLKDTRNNLLTPSKGLYFSFTTGYNFSSGNYLKSAVDLRYYKSMKNTVTWANRVFTEFNFGNPPFYDYAFLGGDKFVRGYNYGRYRDKNLASFQTELRLSLAGRFGLATFGGVSNLFSDLSHLPAIKLNGGLGLRFLVDKHDQTNLRLDYAMGSNGNSGFYISFGESF